MKFGVIGIVITDRSKAAEVQNILSQFADVILGRMGIPDQATGASVISLIVRGSNESLSALTGKLGRIPSVKAKTAVTDVALS